MAAHAIPIDQLENAGQFGVCLRRARIIPGLLRKILVVVFLPRAVRYINRTLSGERTGRLSPEQAQSLYAVMQPFYAELIGMIERFPSRPLWERIILKWWFSRLEAQTEDLGDVLETLAWISDADLRANLKSMVASIEPSPELCHRA